MVTKLEKLLNAPLPSGAAEAAARVKDGLAQLEKAYEALQAAKEGSSPHARTRAEAARTALQEAEAELNVSETMGRTTVQLEKKVALCREECSTAEEAISNAEARAVAFRKEVTRCQHEIGDRNHALLNLISPWRDSILRASDTQLSNAAKNAGEALSVANAVRLLDPIPKTEWPKFRSVNNGDPHRGPEEMEIPSEALDILHTWRLAESRANRVIS